MKVKVIKNGYKMLKFTADLVILNEGKGHQKCYNMLKFTADLVILNEGKGHQKCYKLLELNGPLNSAGITKIVRLKIW